MRVALIGGGTGGHLVPGIALVGALGAETEACFLVAGSAVERKVLAGVPHALEPLFDGGTGRPPPWRADAWWRAVRRFRAARERFDPAVVVVLGGWVALPAVVAGFGGRPSVLVEQNARAGRVQRLLSGRVDHACVPVAGPGMPRGRRGTHVTGNPVPPLPLADRASARARLGLDPGRRTVLLMGGSQGARDLNRLLPELGAVLAAQPDPWQVLHLTGRRERVPGPPEVPVVAHSFLSSMADAYAAADLAVSRAGGCTVAELANTGTPSVLVPYPHHADRHQHANARWLVEAGAALVVPDDDPTGRATLGGLVRSALARLPAMARAAAGAGRPDAAERVAAIVRGLAHGRELAA